MLVQGVEDANRLAHEIRSKAAADARVVFVSGNFNVIHPGHVRLLQFAAQAGDILVVGVLEASNRSVTVPSAERFEGVQAIKVVNYACQIDMPLEQFIMALKPEIIVKGKEHEVRHNPESQLVESYGGKLLFSSGEVRFSSMELIEQEYKSTNFSAIIKPMDFPLRHGFTVGGLKKYISQFSSLKMLVIGDIIVDEYITCDPLGLSQEDPTIVVTPINRRKFVGGAGIVAAHARMLGADVTFLTVAGRDSTASFAKLTLDSYGVDCAIFRDEGRPTTLKQRYRAAGKTLLRVSELRQHAIPNDIAARILDRVKLEMGTTDLVIFSDFNYGCLPQMLVDQITALATHHNVPIFADSQASSQMSDVSRFKGATLLTPTEREARLAMRDSESGLVAIAETLQKKANAKYVMITLGAEGLFTLPEWSTDNWTPDRLPALNTVPKDPAGAGDSLLTCAAMTLCVGGSIWEASYLGSLAAACQVSRVGNTPLEPKDLLQEIDWP